MARRPPVQNTIYWASEAERAYFVRLAELRGVSLNKLLRHLIRVGVRAEEAAGTLLASVPEEQTP